MILKVKNGNILNEDGVIVGVLTKEGYDLDVEKVIEFGSEAAPAITKFIDGVNHGSYTPRKAVKIFEQLIDKHGI